MAKDESLRMPVEEMRLISEQMPDDLKSRPYEDQVAIYLPVLLREIAKLIAKSEQISPAAASDRFMSSKTCQELTTTALDIGSEDPVYYLQKYLNEQKYRSCNRTLRSQRARNKTRKAKSTKNTRRTRKRSPRNSKTAPLWSNAEALFCFKIRSGCQTAGSRPKLKSKRPARR